MITEFVQFGLRLETLLNQWRGLHSLSGMKGKRRTINDYIRSLIPSIWKMVEKGRALLQKLTSPLSSCCREVKNRHKTCPILTLDQNDLLINVFRQGFAPCHKPLKVLHFLQIKKYQVSIFASGPPSSVHIVQEGLCIFSLADLPTESVGALVELASG